jgi:hypothetical protein
MTEAVPVLLLALLAGLTVGLIFLALTAEDGGTTVVPAADPAPAAWQVSELLEEARKITREAADG